MQGHKEQKKPSAIRLGLSAAVGGLSNGLVGTGGGMLLWFGLTKHSRLMPEEVFATGSATVLFFSLASAVTYFCTGRLDGSAVSFYLLPALLGGALGAFLLGKLRTELLKGLFAALLVVSGVLLLVR